jgi:hypothetical protein
MAAGQGFKTFVTGEVLTAGDVNGYLMQGINVFATTTARDAAITAPQEGQFAFTKDTNSLWYYDGAAWVASGATGDIEGVTAGIGISGGGTSGTVTITNSMATAIDAKGDLVAGTGADTFARLAVGANDTVLTADSTAATGLKWAAASGSAKNWVLVNSGGTSLSGGSTQITGLSSYDNLMVIVSGASFTTASQGLYMTVNNVNSSNSYTRYGSRATYAPSYSQTNYTTFATSTTQIQWASMSSSATSTISGGIQIMGCRGTGVKPISLVSASTSASGDSNEAVAYFGVVTATTTISSIEILGSSATFDAGTVYVYGAV